MRTIHVGLTDQQHELLTSSVRGAEAPSLDALAALALSETTATEPVRRPLPRATGTPWTWRDDVAFAPREDRAVRLEHRLAPGTGKAIELRAGQILRVAQVEGNQCADLNAFNLHDYREFLHVGRTRTLHGVNPSEGDFLWSAPPRERALLHVLTDTARTNDTLFPRCSATMYESMFGFDEHTNCADIQAEAQREYGLTPDDVHDSFNLFMATRVLEDGTCEVIRQDTGPEEFIELLALVDLLVVPNVCGNDIFATSNYTLHSLDLTVFDASAADLAAVPELLSYRNQRTPADFDQPAIRVERALSADPTYVPKFARTPVVRHTVELVLDDASTALFEQVRRTDLYDDDGDALRDVLLSWWVRSHA